MVIKIIYLYNNLNFKVNKGDKIAVIGKNGCGKTTFIKLLLGVLNPLSGSITLNNTDLKQLTKRDLYNNISVVLQNSTLFSFKISENISCKKESDIDREKLDRCIVNTNLKNIIERFANKENSFIGSDYDSNGINFSSGEKQKLLMARMLYKDASLILLDEPTKDLSIIKKYSVAIDQVYYDFDYSDLIDDYISVIKNILVICCSLSFVFFIVFKHPLITSGIYSKLSNPVLDLTLYISINALVIIFNFLYSRQKNKIQNNLIDKHAEF